TRPGRTSSAFSRRRARTDAATWCGWCSAARATCVRRVDAFLVGPVSEHALAETGEQVPHLVETLGIAPGPRLAGELGQLIPLRVEPAVSRVPVRGPQGVAVATGEWTAGELENHRTGRRHGGRAVPSAGTETKDPPARHGTSYLDQEGALCRHPDGVGPP